MEIIIATFMLTKSLGFFKLAEWITAGHVTGLYY